MMAAPLKNRDFNRRADQFYDYLIGRKGQILRYITAALLTALAEFFLKRFFFSTQQTVMLPFFIRFILLFPALKYWVYREIGQDIFITLKQAMITVMLVVLAQFAINYLTIFLATITGHPAIMNYICRAIAEILFFVIFQFVVFKEKKD